MTGGAAQLKPERLAVFRENFNAPKIRVDVFHNSRPPITEVDDCHPGVDARNGSGWRCHGAILAHDRVDRSALRGELVEQQVDGALEVGDRRFLDVDDPESAI